MSVRNGKTTGGGKLGFLEQNLSQCQFVPSSTRLALGLNPGLHGGNWQLTTRAMATVHRSLFRIPFLTVSLHFHVNAWSSVIGPKFFRGFISEAALGWSQSIGSSV
jgi:hypothetical protein